MTNANPVYSFCLVLLMAGFFLSSCTENKATESQSPPRTFKVETLRTQNDQIIVASPQEGIFEVRSETGVGNGGIELVEGEWPEFCTIRLFLNNLEGFKLIIESELYDKYELEVSDKIGDEDPYFEVKIPRTLLLGGTKRFDFNFVDYYRN